MIEALWIVTLGIFAYRFIFVICPLEFSFLRFFKVFVIICMQYHIHTFPIIFQNIDDDLKRSKQNIIEAAEATMGGTFNVICAKSHFSYSNVFTSVTDEASAKNL